MAQIVAVVGYAAVVAFTVLPFLAVIAVLLDSGNPRRGWELTAGYALGLLSVFAAASFGLARLQLPPLRASGVVELVVGALLLLIAGGLWWWRRESPETHRSPRLRRRKPAREMGMGRTVVLGVQFAVHPENLALTFGAASHVTDMTDPQKLAAALLFAAIGVVTVALPAMAFSIAGDRTRERLAQLRASIDQHGPLLTRVLLAAVGLVLVSLGLWQVLSL